MNISKSVWHYKIIKKFLPSNKPVPTNLCPYVRALVWRLMVIVGIAGVVTFLCYSVGLGGAAILQKELGWYLLNQTVPSYWYLYPIIVIAGLLLITSIIALCIFLVALIFFILTTSEKCWKNRGKVSIFNTIKMSDNLAIKYIQAKHSKICPRITFKD